MRIAVTGGSGFIGTNFLDHAVARGHDVCSLDIRRPMTARHEPFWEAVDVQDTDRVTRIFERWRPGVIVHLAARADTDSEDVSDYSVNVEGTRSVAYAAATVGAVARLVHASTQYVFTLGRAPVNDEDFEPFTAYGESKVASERVLRSEQWPFDWTIVRPTNIWGPWHPRYPHEFWRVVERGLYLHPSGPRVRRAYGYVGTVCAQLLCLLAAPQERVAGRVFYVGDEALWLDDWVDGFHRALRGRPARRVPLTALRVLARVGDIAGRARIKAPLTSTRLSNMTEEHLAPMQGIFELCGPSPYTLDDGIAATVSWLRDQRAIVSSA